MSIVTKVLNFESVSVGDHAQPFIVCTDPAMAVSPVTLPDASGSCQPLQHSQSIIQLSEHRAHQLFSWLHFGKSFKSASMSKSSAASSFFAEMLDDWNILPLAPIG